MMTETTPDARFIARRLLLAGGPPRGGTTLLAKLLNAHRDIVTVIDNAMHENWALYNYRTRTGLVQKIRAGEISGHDAEKAADLLFSHITHRGYLRGVPAGPGMDGRKAVPLASQANQPAQTATRLKRFVKHKLLRRPLKQARYLLPLRDLPAITYFCLKSPEISFVLPPLAHIFPNARFVLVYRPAHAVAESMYRKGNTWTIPSYHRRWARETTPEGRPILPPGVPAAWQSVWEQASDFQRCVMYAASYLKAIAESLPLLPAGSVFLYAHSRLCHSPERVLNSLFTFLGLSWERFEPAYAPQIRDTHPELPPRLWQEYAEIAPLVKADEWESRLHAQETER